MAVFTRCGLLALAPAVNVAPVARAQGPLGPREEFLEPHQLMKGRFENWEEGQRLAAGYYDYELGQGRYPGRVFFRTPAVTPRLRTYGYPRAYTPRAADVRPVRVREVYRLRVIPASPVFPHRRPRVSDSAPSGAGAGLSNPRP
jgi:hypothetical protein